MALTPTPAKRGQRFGVYNGDAKGTVIDIDSQSVHYRYDHDVPEKSHVHSRTWFDSSTFPLAAK